MKKGHGCGAAAAGCGCTLFTTQARPPCTRRARVHGGEIKGGRSWRPKASDPLL